jgi:hypothetical protein
MKPILGFPAPKAQEIPKWFFESLTKAGFQKPIFHNENCLVDKFLHNFFWI